MTLFIYALRDRVSDTFRQVTVNESDPVAKRDLAMAVNQNPQLAFISRDLELCNIGTIDNKSGVITPASPIEVVCRADQLIGAEENVKNEVV